MSGGAQAAGTTRALGMLGYPAARLRLTMALLLLLSLALQILTLGLPLYMMHLFDGVAESHSLDTAYLLTLLYFGVISLATLYRYLRDTILQVAARHLVRRLFLNMLLAAVRFGLAGQPDRAATALKDHAELQRFLAGRSLSDVLDLVTTPLLLGFLVLMHPLYGLIAALGAGLLAGFNFLVERQSHAVMQRATELQSKATTDLSRRLQRRDEVEGLGLLRGALRQWRPLFLTAMAVQESAARRAKAAASISALLHMLVQAAIFACGVWLVIHAQAAPGSIIACAMMAGLLLAPFEHISQNLLQWTMARLAFLRLTATLAAADAEVSSRPEEGGSGLVVQGLTVTVPGRAVPLAEGLELAVPPGSVLIVTGANGVGKSTLLRTLIGLRPPASGQALLDGQDVHAASRLEIGPRIGFLGQRADLLNASILDNISRFTDRAAEAVEAARLAGAHEMIGRLPQGYAAPAGSQAGLSGGQQRLIALARAFFGTPRLIVLDEPEAGLDPGAVTALRNAVRELRRRGCVLVIVTHGAKAWQEIADQELRLAADGRWACGWLHEAAAAAV